MMDVGVRTPLLDLFRRGDVDRDIRLLAAQGALAPRAYEQLALLVMLVADPDAEVAGAAERTLQAIPRPPLEAFLARPEATEDLRMFFAGRGIMPAAGGTADPDVPLLDVSSPPDTVVEEEAAPDGKERPATLQKIAAMTIAQRVALAMKGTREERAVLIRDPNKLVAAAVLSSPKLTETEVESIARMATLSDEILRIIANTRAWVKNYQVVVALTNNPKTPVAISMNLLQRLNDRDMRVLSTNRNVPEILRVTARKKLVIG